MARPSKLTDKQRDEIQRRHATGETTRALAKVYKVSQATIATIVSGQTETVQRLAASIVSDERTLASLPVSAQATVLTLADRLRGISEGLGAAAHHNANVAARFAKMADRKAEEFEQLTLLKPERANLRDICELVDTATRAGSLGSNLLNANRNKTPEGALTLEQLVMGEAVAS